jgi:sugar lactone lactonase YvrE
MQNIDNATGGWRAWLAALCMTILTACGGGDDAPPPPPTEGSATVGAAGGIVTGPDGVRLFLPPGAVETDATFRIARDGSDAPPLPAGIDLASEVYAITPHRAAFGASASVELPVSSALAAGRPTFLMKADPGGRWSVVSTGLAGASTLRAGIDSLSYLAVGACQNNLPASSPFGQACPTSNRLSLELLINGTSPVPISQDTTYGAPIPVLLVTTPETLTFRMTWTRPAGTNRVDSLDTGTAYAGTSSLSRQAGFTFSPTAPRFLSANDNSFSRTFTVEVDPARVSGASGPNGVVRRIWAQASYNVIGPGNVGSANWDFTAWVPIQVRSVASVVLPVIATQPANASVSDGQPAGFSVTASITPAAALTYQWSRSASPGSPFTAITGATAASFNIASATLADDGAQFQVVVCAAPTRCVTSSPATLTVTRAPIAPSFTLQPASIAVVAGQTASFTVTATGNPLPRIDWQSAPASDPNNFTALLGAPTCVRTDPPASGTNTTATCTVGPLSVGDNGRRYRAVATNSATTTNSTVATLTVNTAPMAPAITQQPQAQTTTVGGSATFNVTATGTAPLAYAWQLGGTNLPSVSGGFNTGNCQGTVTYSNGGATITLSGLFAGCNGVSVNVTVSNGVNPSAASSSAVLTVNPVTQGLALLAGDIGGAGSLDGTGADARVILSPENGIAFDTAGNAYFSETISGRVRKITPAGVVTTIAGATTPLRNPAGVAIDSAGNVFVAERSTGRILRITPAGVLSAWTPQGSLSVPTSLAIDANDNLYVTSESGSGDGLISRVSPAQLISPFYAFASGDRAGAIAVAADGNVFAVGGGALYGTVVRITAAGVRSVLAGEAGQEGNVDATGPGARFFGINGLAIGVGGDLFATDGNNRSVRRITLAGVVTTVSGANAAPFEPRDGAGTAARYDFPGAIGAAPSGDLLIGDGSAMRKLAPVPIYAATTIAGKRLQVGTTDGVGTAARFNCLCDVTLDAAGNAYLVSAGGMRKVAPDGTVTTIPVTPSLTYYIAFDASRGELVAASPFAVWRVTTAGVATLLAGDPAGQAYVDGTGAAARFYQIAGLAVDAAGNVFVSEGLSYTIRRITPAGVVTTYAGAPDQPGTADGAAADARFLGAGGLAVDGGGNLFVASNLTIRRITPAGQVSTVAGTPNVVGSVDGTGAAARFREPRKLAVEPSGNLLISDGTTLRRMAPANVVTTVMGIDGDRGVRLGASPRLNSVGGMAVRPNGQVVLFSEAAVLQATVP